MKTICELEAKGRDVLHVMPHWRREQLEAAKIIQTILGAAFCTPANEYDVEDACQAIERQISRIRNARKRAETKRAENDAAWQNQLASKACQQDLAHAVSVLDGGQS